MSFDYAAECLARALRTLGDQPYATLAALEGAKLTLEIESIVGSEKDKACVADVRARLYTARYALSCGDDRKTRDAIQTAIQLVDEHLDPERISRLEAARWQQYLDECGSVRENFGSPLPESAQFDEPYEMWEREAEKIERTFGEDR